MIFKYRHYKGDRKSVYAVLFVGPEEGQLHRTGGIVLRNDEWNVFQTDMEYLNIHRGEARYLFEEIDI